MLGESLRRMDGPVGLVLVRLVGSVLGVRSVLAVRSSGRDHLSGLLFGKVHLGVDLTSVL
jgi:hypothetical protein